MINYLSVGNEHLYTALARDGVQPYQRILARERSDEGFPIIRHAVIQ